MNENKLYIIEQISFWGIAIITILIFYIFNITFEMKGFWIGFIYCTVLNIHPILFKRYISNKFKNKNKMEE